MLPQLISIIIPSYNSALYLPEAIQSALSQSYRDIELIVVNDGSTDNTHEIIQQYLDKIIYIKKKNGGPASARNLGIAHSKGEYIAFLDADDLWLPDKLEKQLAKITESPDGSFVYTGFTNFDDQNGTMLPGAPDTPAGMLFDRLLVESVILLSTVLLRRDVLLEAGCFDADLQTAEDTNLWLKIARSHRIEVIPEVLVQRRLHGNNISHRIDIPVGTLENLDKIVARYPDTAPDRYGPMKRAYECRGLAMAEDYFHGGNYEGCRMVCRRLKSLGIDNSRLQSLSFKTSRPDILNEMLRLSKSLIRRVAGKC